MAVLALVSTISAPATSLAPPGDDVLRIEAISNRADLVSGGDVLVRIVPPASAMKAAAAKAAALPELVSVGLNGRLLHDILRPDPAGRGVLARVARLQTGVNTLTASVEGQTAELKITNHPIGGPIFAGPQVQPWICDTEANGLGPPQDAQCNTPTVYEYQYKSSVTGQFAAYDPENPPSDVATTTTDQGSTVPYIVRIERGVIDRGIYAIAVLFDPEKKWEPWSPQPGFNGKLVVPFGGDCQPRHSQGAPSGVMDDFALSRGFAVLNSNLNVLGQNCNDVVSAEALMMLKEHFTETYGPMRYTIGNGCSGGSMQQNWIVSNYPGLLDGIQPSCSYPDIWETMQEAEDCHLMDRYFDETSPHLWVVVEQQAFVAGYQAPTTCRSLWDAPVTNAYSRLWLDPDNFAGCLGSGPTAGIGGTRPDWVYEAQANPKGVRCTLHDYGVSIWGRRAKDGFANRPFDNVGVQYGLKALESGEILPEQFVDLNEKVGGLDIDWNWQPERSVADPAALEVAYRSGRVSSMREAAKVPIIDLPLPENLEIHTPFHSYTIRARLTQANGHADNHVIWQGSGGNSFIVIDKWLAAIEADHSEAPLEEKVVRNKPAEAVDACWVGDHKITDLVICRTLFPYYADPRISAGAPLADDIMKCQLKSLNRSDYTVEFTDAQWARLEKAFPTGVCNYRKPGVGQEPNVPWLTYADGPGGKPVGPAPTSRVVSGARVKGISRRLPAEQLPATGVPSASVSLGVFLVGVAGALRLALRKVKS